MTDFFQQTKIGSKLAIAGATYEVVGKGAYVTESAPDDVYYKLALSDHHALVIIPSDEIVYFGRDVGDCSAALDAEEIIYDGITYKLVGIDYQIPVYIDESAALSCEGEVRFWDYESTEDETKIISVAVVSRGGHRSDVIADIIDPSLIEPQ